MTARAVNHPLRAAGLLLFPLLLAAGLARAQLVINELAYDDSGDDDEEYVEIFNPGEAAVDLAGWWIVTGDENGPGRQYALPAGRRVEPGGFFVLGSSRVPGVDDPRPETELFANGPGFLILWQEDDGPIDAVAYETNKGTASFPPEALSEGGIWGNHVLVAGSHLSWQRWLDGRDTGENGADFGHLPWTPGKTNDRVDPPAFQSDFEAGAPETPVRALPGSFAPGRIVDPATPSASNPDPIPPSPQGGQALVAWDPAGGGNFVALEAAPRADMVFEAWVYLDAEPEPPGESETWSLGLRGTSGTFFNTPILSGANGNTGVTWTYQVTGTDATLYLVDEGYGIPPGERNRLAAIDIIPGENDGWQRLRLEVAGRRVTGHFGGTYGSLDDGERIEGQTAAVGIGSFYIGYREALTVARPRPPTLDALRVGEASGAGPPPFTRGDVNADGGTDISDPVRLLNWLFLGGAEPPCVEAADANDNGGLELTDAIYLLNWLFRAGDAPPAPFTGCGEDPTPDALGCEGFSACP